MKGIYFSASCPVSGHDLRLIASTPADSFRWDQRAVVKCTGRQCGYRFVIDVQIMFAEISPEMEPSKCGTVAGHRRHSRAGEAPCEACRLAVVEANQTPERIARRRVIAKERRQRLDA